MCVAMQRQAIQILDVIQHAGKPIQATDLWPLIGIDRARNYPRPRLHSLDCPPHPIETIGIALRVNFFGWVVAIVRPFALVVHLVADDPNKAGLIIIHPGRATLSKRIILIGRWYCAAAAIIIVEPGDHAKPCVRPIGIRRDHTVADE